MNKQNLGIGRHPETSAEGTIKQVVYSFLPLWNKGRCKEHCSAAAQPNCPPFQAAATEGRSQFRDHRRGYSQISGEYLARPAMRHNASNGSADELMLELNVGEPRCEPYGARRSEGVGNPNAIQTSNPRHPESAGRRIHCRRNIKTGFFRATPSHNDVHKSQSGRSLTEMLGTLAIMGILSIGAIAGFNYAMNKHRANELLDEARKRAYTVMTQIQLGLPRSLGEYSRHNTFAGGTFSPDIVMIGLTGQFGLKVTGMKKPVCQHILDSISDKSLIRRLSNEIAPTTALNKCADDTSDYLLVYNNTMDSLDPTAALCNRDQDCTDGCAVCENHRCVENCGTGNACGKNITNATQRICCSKDKYLDGYCCRKIVDGNCLNNFDVGCPADYFYGDLNGTEGCYPCSDNRLFNSPTGLLTTSCKACSNRDQIFGYCVLPDHCGPGQILHQGDQCGSCASNRRLNMSMGYGRTREQSVRDCITNCADYNPNRKIGCYRTRWNGTGCFCYPNGCPNGSSDTEHPGICLSNKGYYYNYYASGTFYRCPTNLETIDNWQYCSDECHLTWTESTKTCSFPTDVTVMDYQWGCEAAGGEWSGYSQTNGECLPKTE